MKKLILSLFFIFAITLGGSYIYHMYNEIQYDNMLLQSLNNKHNLIKRLPNNINHQKNNTGFFITGNVMPNFNQFNSKVLNQIFNTLQNNNTNNSVNNINQNNNLINSLNQNNNTTPQTNSINNNKVSTKGKLLLPQGNIIVNGLSLTDTLQGNKAIYNMAQKITRDYKNPVDKAKALYVWVAANMTYNTNYEKELEKGIFPKGQGTAIDTFNNKNGVCSGFAALYFVMARDVGLNVKMVAGQGLADAQTNTWGNHMWNEVYLNGRWVPVDTTFANSYTLAMEKLGANPKISGYLSNRPTYIDKQMGNQIEQYSVPSADFFNPPNFNETHRDSQVLATWIN